MTQNVPFVLRWSDQTLMMALFAAGTHTPDEAESVADAVAEESRRVPSLIQGNRSSDQPISRADLRLIVEGTLRRCVEIIETASAKVES